MVDFTSNFSDPTFFIPLLFTLAIVFGVLELGNPLKNRAVNLIIAFAISLFAASYGPFQSIIWTYLPNVTWFFIIIFFVAFTLELFGFRKQGQGDTESMIASGGVLLILMGVGWMVLQKFPVQLPLIGGGQNLLFLIGFLFILSLFWAAMKIGAGQQPQPQRG